MGPESIMVGAWRANASESLAGDLAPSQGAGFSKKGRTPLAKRESVVYNPFHCLGLFSFILRSVVFVGSPGE